MSVSPERLDLKDRKLLYELDLNSRTPLSKIAKKIGLSPEVVNYRIKRLEKENIITQYQVIVNLAALNIIQFKICLLFQHMTSENFAVILDKVKKMNAVKWIVSCKGNWDLIISVETDCVENVDNLKNEIISLFGNNIRNKAISILVEAQTYFRDYLIPTKDSLSRSRLIMKKDIVKKDKEYVLDDLDIAILKKLAENARKSIVEIAAELKQTIRIVNYRIKQLERKKIILGYKVALNYEKLGIKFFKTFIYLDNPTKNRLSALTSYLGQNKNVIHDVKVLGNWDLEPEFEVYNEEEFDTIIKEIKDKFSDIIKEMDIITISKEHKFVYF